MPDSNTPQNDDTINDEITYQQALIIQNALGGLVGGLGNVFPIALIKAVLSEVVGLEEFWEQLIQQEQEAQASQAENTDT